MRKFKISTQKRQYKELCTPVLILFLLFFIQVSSTAQCSMSCKGINISIDGTECEADIRPSDILTEACSDPGVMSYTITINDHHGNFVVQQEGLAFDGVFMWMDSGAFSGQEVQIEVSAVGPDGVINSCWNTALIEDKKAPVLDCGTAIGVNNNELIIKCCDGSQIDVALMREAFTECSDFEVVVLEQNDRAADCQTESNYTRVIEILAYGIDEFGNQSETCNILVKVERLFPELTMIPGNAPMLCETMPMLDSTLLVCPDTLLFSEGDAINCADIDDYVTIMLNTSQGPIQVPAPIPVSEGGAGVPILIKDIDAECGLGNIIRDTVYLRTMDSGHPDALDLLANCNVGVSYSDLFMGQTNCVTKIRRTWFIREWHCSDEGEILCNQIIEIADTEGPVVLDSIPGFEATTNGFDCHATITLPDVPFSDNCGDVDHIDVIHPLGIVKNFDKASAVEKRISLPEGIDTIIYRAYDKCHRSTDYQMVISVWDNTPPVPICDDNLVISLTYDGAAEVRSSSFDDGSYDDCQLKTTLVRKMNPDNCDCSLHPPKFEDFKSLGIYEGHHYYLSEKPVIRAKALKLGIAYGGYLAAMDGNRNRPSAADRSAEREWLRERVGSFFDPVPRYFVSPEIVRSVPKVESLDGPSQLYVIELEDPCTFSNSIHFCCGDLAEDENMVVLRAVDKWGNFNECMVSVELQDKSQPEIICPPNLVLACEFDGVDVDNLDAFFGTVISGNQLDAFNGFALTGSGSTGGAFVGFYPGDNPEGTSVDTTKVHYFNNGYAIDNCAANLVIEELEPMDMRDQCGRGDLIRKFIAYNPGQQQFATDPCEQLLSFIPTDTFNFENIDATELEDEVFCVTELGDGFCIDLSSNTESLFPSSEYGEPFFPGEDNCDLLGVQYEDQVFYVGNPDRNCAGDEMEGEFCYKILRNWTIINWCNLNNSTPGVFDDRVELEPQIFYIKDDTDPFIVNNVNFDHEDKEKFCSFDPSCGPTMVVIRRRGNVRNVSCSEREDLEWYYCLEDENGDFVMGGEQDGNDLLIEKELPIGNYNLEYALYDKCGNVVNFVTRIVVEYCKAPTAYCLNGLAVSLNEHGNVELWASDFARDVSNACIEDVALSFSATDIDMRNITLCCEDVGIVQVDIFFTTVDADGNVPMHEGEDIIRQSVCTSMISVQDNGNVCGGNNDMGCDAKESNIVQNGNRALISGSISRPDNAMISNVDVELEGSSEITNTDIEGYYAFPSMPIGGQYVVTPQKSGDPVEGVSTLDLVLIQKHILGLGNLDSPYKYIAADVNSDKAISALDIVSLRKVILGLESEFPNNSVWNFINSEYTFFDIQNPLSENYKGRYEINALNDDMDIHFLAIKTGDVNYSAEVNGFSNSETRSMAVLELSLGKASKSNNRISIPLLVSKGITLDGYQFTVEFDDNYLTVSDIITNNASLLSDENFGIHTDKGMLTVSWHANDSHTFNNQDELFTIEFVNKLPMVNPINELVDISSSITKAEAYYESELMDILMSDTETFGSVQLELFQNTPNPFADKTTIAFELPTSGNASLSIHSLTGQVIYQVDGFYPAGSHKVELDKEKLDYTGVLYYTLQYDGESLTKQMIIIE